MDDPVVEPASPDRSGPAVLPLRGPEGAPWQGVDRRLVTARSLALAAVALPLVIVAVVLAAVVSPRVWIAAAVVPIGWVWAQVIILLQVPAISWAELPEELAIRRGRMWRSLVTVPYGRIQYVDLESGPMLRALGLATITVNTASPESSGTIPGLPTQVAEELRVRLAARGEAKRAGL